MAQAEVCKTFYAGSIPAAASQEHSPSTTKERLVATVSVRYIVVRNDVVVGTGGKQILVDDPSGNPVELFEPTIPEARL